MSREKENKFYHALQFNAERCIGCSKCMSVCPTEAIRVKNGKAFLFENRCIDCGECYRICPVGALEVKQDDFEKIFDFKYRVALVPSVLIGQFADDAPVQQIFSAITELGFDEVREVEQTSNVIIDHYNKKISLADSKPLISAFCPAIVRLIQVKYPSLVNNIIPSRQALDLTALSIRREFKEKNITQESAGVFYITPCAAKIAAVKSPVGNDDSGIDGVINMDFLFNKIYKNLITRNAEKSIDTNVEPLSSANLQFSLTQGEKKQIEGRALAIDGIENVIEILEKVENEKLKNIDFLELRACDESCAGGILTSSNRFLTVERMQKRADQAYEQITQGKHLEATESLKESLIIPPIKPRSMEKLDEDFSQALAKMNRYRNIMDILPQVDCGVCGAPSCHALAQDVVQGKAKIDHCIFVQRQREQTAELNLFESVDIMKGIWGDDKLQQKN